MRCRSVPALLAFVLVALALGACVAGVETGDDCVNGRDDDNDELVDCDDPNCKLTLFCSTCGNDTIDPGESCDDGNQVAGDGCDDRCLDELCGNGRIDGDEECDDGNLTPADGCSFRCRESECGDRILNANVEECEDGNTVSGDGCSEECDSEVETCGNGQVDFDPKTFVQLEECDFGPPQGGDGCSATCEFEQCGDGITQPTLSEECDDADPFKPAGCQFCRLPRCGDFFLSPGEGCDDGNRISGDGCSADCQRE